MDKKVLGFSSLILTAFFFGFYGILTRIVGFNIPLFFASFMRNGFGMLILFGVIAFVGGWKPIRSQDYIWIFLRSICGMIAFFGSFVPIMHLPIGTFYFISYAGITIGGYIIAKVLLNERITNVKVVSLILALIGLCFIYSINVESLDLLYVAFAFIGGFGASGWNILAKKISHYYSALQLNLIDFFTYSFYTFIISLILQETWLLPVINDVWAAQLGFVLMFLVTGQLIIYGFKFLDAQIGSLVLLLEILFGTLFAYLFFHEAVSFMTMVGGALIIIAIVLPEVIVQKKKV